MRWGIIVFPGSNCDRDSFYVLNSILKYKVSYLWHAHQAKYTLFRDFDALLLPGGFAYGDYLRPGALASLSPIMSFVKVFADAGGLVLGICNGFQILLEAGLFSSGKPFMGTLLKNQSGRFISCFVYVRKSAKTLGEGAKNVVDDVFYLPVAHSVGRFFCTDDQLKELQDNDQILFQYCSKEGSCTQESNPNGSINNIAAISNKKGNVVAIMPHPERASEKLLGSTDGLRIFQLFI